jgi:hypothetical protein
MTSLNATEAVDPSGLNGERYVHNARQFPYLVELYAYPASLSLDAIKAAWLAVLPIGSCAGFTQEGIRGGLRLVKIDRFVREPKRLTPIDEPSV